MFNLNLKIRRRVTLARDSEPELRAVPLCTIVIVLFSPPNLN